MSAAITREELEKILGQALQDAAVGMAGVRLRRDGPPLGEDLCTVHITFFKGFSTSLTLCADTGLLFRMARSSFREETVTPEDMEEFSKEYFNVLCGKVAGAIFRATRASARFSPPAFYRGRYEPEGQEVQLVLTYRDEHRQGVQLSHHLARPQEGKVKG